jgi:menaquinone-dependent protoporphyrinogen oxidase
LRYDKYDFFQEQIIRHVVLKDRAPDVIDGDHDFTDWDALGAFVDDFTGKAGTGAV